MSNRNYVDGFYEIPIVKLKHHYFINNECTIIHIKNKRSPVPEEVYKVPEEVYKWNTNTKNDILKIYNYTDKKEVSTTPIELYMLTFYGYLPFKIKAHFPSEPTEFYYKIPLKEDIDDSTIVLGNIEFKKSSLFPNGNVYVSDDGCIYDRQRDRIMRQRFKHKEYNYRCYGTFKVHQIVYDAWVGELDLDKEIHHKDDNDWNNDVTNLVQLTREEHLDVHRYRINSKESIIELCELMSSGMPPCDAARETGVTPSIAGSVRRKEIYKDISSNYNFPEYTNRGGAILKDDDVHSICKLLSEGKLRNSEIGKMYGVNPYTIQDIRKGCTWRQISDNYDFVRESNLSSHSVDQKVDMEHYSPKSAKISVDQVKNIWEHLQNGESIRSVSELFGISYGIVKKIRGRVRWTKVTNQLGPLPNENTKIMHNISVQRLSKGCIESE